MVNYIYLNLRLKTIEEFFNRVTKEVDTEIKDIFAREEAEEFTETDDFDNALFYPLETEAIAIRTVFYEINALVENYLRGKASDAYQNSPKYKNKKKSFSDISSIGEVPELTLIYDLPFSEICKLIEDYYKTKLKDLPSSEFIQFIRQSINSFKHNDGFKDFRKSTSIDEEHIIIGERFILKREDAHKAINGARTFLIELQKI